MGQIIGIDFGTSNSSMAALKRKIPYVIPNAEGSLITPSVVAFKGSEILVGQSAKNQAILNPERTIIQIKRKIGSDYKITINEKDFTPHDIIAMIFQKLRTDAEAYFNEEIKQAVVTVPPHFNENQRRVLIEAGTIAGLDIIKTISEPLAAGITYCSNKNVDGILIMLDFGGGTFGVTIINISSGILEVLSTSGDNRLGGMDIDDKIIEYLIAESKLKKGIDLKDDRAVLQRLRDAAERAKIELSSTVTTTISLPFIATDASRPKHLEMKLSRAKLEELVEPVLARCDVPIKRALSDAKLDSEDIDRIILVGGVTRIPLVRKKFEMYIGKKAEGGVDPIQCMAMGAAIHSGILVWNK